MDEFEPLFDYSRVQHKNVVFVNDDEVDQSPICIPLDKRHKCGKANKAEDGKKEEERGEKVVVSDDDDDDWLASPPPPPPKLLSNQSELEEDSTIKELRLKKEELASLAQSAEDIIKSVTDSIKRDICAPENFDTEPKVELPSKKASRNKILISVQDKDGQQQFRLYTDENFERLFKIYAGKVELPVESLVFSFDGDKVSPTATPQSLGLEEDDMIEVHHRSK